MENTRGLAYFCLGCAAGAAAAVIFTPRSGRETVQYLRRKAEEGTDYLKQRTDSIKQTVDKAGETVANLADRGARTVRYQTENLGAAVEAGKQAFKSAQETTP